MKRPGVVIIIWAPLVVNSFMSWTTVWAPPINWRCVIWGRFFRNSDNTSLICDANSLVGEIISAPISNFFRGSGLASRISRMGMMNASVFPEPVTASTQTSFFWRNNGIQAAYKQVRKNITTETHIYLSKFTWTGVVSLKFRSSNVWRIGSLSFTPNSFQSVFIFLCYLFYWPCAVLHVVYRPLVFIL